MAVDSGEFSMTINDSANKKTTTKVHTVTPSAANLADLIQSRDKFINVMESLILGVIQTANIQLHKNFLNGLPGTDDAVRSKKFIFNMRATSTGEPYHFTVGTVKDFDGTDLKRAGNSNQVDITTAWWTDPAENDTVISRINAIQAFAKSPESAGAGTLESVWLVDN